MRRVEFRNNKAIALSLSAFGLLIVSPVLAVPIEDAEIQFVSNFGSGVQEFNEDVLLQETNPHPSIEDISHSAFAEIADGAIRMSLFGNCCTSELNAAVRDTYTVHGDSLGAPVTLTVQLDVQGEITTGPLHPNPGRVDATIGGDLTGGSLSGGGIVPSPLIAGNGYAYGGVNQFIDAGSSLQVDLPVSTEINVQVGDTFTLVYLIQLRNDGAEMLSDFTNTATVSFDLPVGVALTSTNGFGMVVPEPTGLVLASCGALGLFGVASRRRTRFKAG